MADERYEEAVRVFALEAEALTTEQIEVLAQVDEVLGKRAQVKRQAALLKTAEARHRAAMGESLKKRDRTEEMADAVVDQIALSLAHPRQRITALEALVERLETRVLELEAQAALRAVTP